MSWLLILHQKKEANKRQRGKHIMDAKCVVQCKSATLIWYKDKGERLQNVKTSWLNQCYELCLGLSFILYTQGTMECCHSQQSP